MRKHAHQGFTLVELLVVISIISLLSSVVLTSVNSARVKSRDARRLSDMKQIQLALEFYYGDNGEYPHVGNNGRAWSQATTWDTLATALQPYIDPLPVDPLDTGAPEYFDYYYESDTGDEQQSYGLMMQVEDSSNYPLATNDGGYWPETNVWYYVEFGTQPSYCITQYGVDDDWYAGAIDTVCEGGN